MLYRCNECDTEFDTPGEKCYHRPGKVHCIDRDFYHGRGECSCLPCCVDCGSEDFDEIEENDGLLEQEQ
jgi:hypothetical protein